MTTETSTNDTTPTKTGDPVGWFEIGTDDPSGARSFYTQAFGWTFDIQGPYSVITTGAGHTLQGGIQDTSPAADLPDGVPGTYAMPCIQVSDVAVACSNIENLGGKVLVGATEVPGMGLVYAHVTDPAGNHLGLFCPPPTPA